ncbi:GAF and ANTAR domain-containing protein [Mycolicibacterium madagascariense]|nr:GAF and ANTAR domain-containing protein [Mycolicibacterium madagascariense]
MTDLTHRFAHPTNVDEILYGITTAAVNLIDAVDSCDVLLIEHAEKFRSVATTSPVAAELDGIQHRHGEGPCIDAAVGDTMALSNDLRDDERWPRFATAAVEAGVHSVLSFQLYTHQKQPTCRGALNLFSSRPNAFDSDAQAIGAMLATHAAIVLIAQDREAQFQSALASRDAIGQAKGMIMERFRVDAVRAFELLKKLSQDTNTRLVDVAAQIVASGPPE